MAQCDVERAHRKEGHLIFRIQQAERAGKGNGFSSVSAAAEPPAGVIELESPVMKPVLRQELKGQDPGVEGIHAFVGKP